MKKLNLKTASIFLFSVCILHFAGCSSITQEPVPVYHVDEITEEAELKFTDLTDHIRIIPLETNDTVQISESIFGGYKIAVTEDYIIVLGDNAILQFDISSGKFIKRLSAFGRGPNEHGYIVAYAIDPAGNILYVSHTSGTNKLAIDLTTGKFLPSVSTVPSASFNDDFFITPAGDIIIPDDSLMFCKIDNSTGNSVSFLTVGNLSRMKEKKRAAFIRHFGNASVLSNKNDLFLFNQKISDTLYKFISPDKCEKILAISSDNIKEELNGTTLKIPYIDQRTILCCGILFRYGQDDNGNYYAISTPAQLYKISREKRQARKINKFIFDPLFTLEKKGIGIARFFNKSCYINNELFAKIVDAYIVKESVARMLEGKNLSRSTKEALEKLDSQVDENSNPVVIIGKKK